ncbi:MAG: tRNA (adenine-N1)-methyltransferase [Deltaproteobacteria bacterium]|nr:tRNA (adenine-N1)-methyltransferase [Deltaproteobacteria bacterium]
MSDRSLLRSGDTVLFIDTKEREYLRTLKAGNRMSLHGGLLPADQVIGLPEGSLVRNSTNDAFWVFRPTYAHLIPNLPRRAQVIYPKDVGMMLLWGDVFPGASVVEVGAGPGSLAIALLRAIGSTGKLTTIEIREDHCDMARENVTKFFGEAPNWTLLVGDAYVGLDVQDADRLFIDVPEPWRVLPHAAQALRPGGVIVSYSPTMIQVKSFVDELRASPCFTAIEVMENLVRGWHVKGLSVRPDHRMVAHTGFLTIARRTSLEPNSTDPLPPPPDPPDEEEDSAE